MSLPLGAAEVTAINTALGTTLTVAQANQLQTRLFKRDEEIRQTFSTYQNILSAQANVVNPGSPTDIALQKAAYLFFDTYPGALSIPPFSRPA